MRTSAVIDPRVWSTPAFSGRRRRGAALILVIAVLGILFVAGAALLNTVTFSNDSLQAEQAARENAAVIDSVEGMVGDMLAQGFLAPDGVPYSANTTGLVTRDPSGGGDVGLVLPTFGEIPGFHPWVDVTEPFDEGISGGTGDNCSFKLNSCFPFALARKPVMSPDRINQVGTFGDLPHPQNSDVLAVRVNDPFTPEYIDSDSQTQILFDADGDGVYDTWEFAIPRDLLAPPLRRRLADRLRAPSFNYSAVSAAEADRLWLSLRIVPHTAMANLNDSDELISRAALDLDPFGPAGSSFTYKPYLPEACEALLRHRGSAVPPRNMEPINLLADNAMALLQPHDGGSGVTGLPLVTDPLSRRWWQYDPARDTEDLNDEWRQMFSPEAAPGVYNTMHNVTTISYDDLLNRGIRDGNGNDVVEEMSMGQWIWKSYPQHLTTLPDASGQPRNPLAGRLQLSMPYLDKLVREAGADGLADLLGAMDIPNPFADGVTPKQKGRAFVARTIQEAFMLMLRNRPDSDFAVYSSGSAVPDNDTDLVRAFQAAMLTANLLDYVDDNPDQDATGETILNYEIPTRVVVRDVYTNAPILPPEGPAGEPLAVYGFERQPFLTEVYAGWYYDSANPAESLSESVFAFELYNPYADSLKLNHEYRIQDVPASAASNARDFFGVDDQPLVASLDGMEIPPRSHVIVYSGAYKSVNVPNAVVLPDETAGWILDENTNLKLVRRLDSGEEIVLDTFDVRGGLPEDVPIEPLAVNTNGAPGGNLIERDWERDSSIDPGTGLSNWRFPVPRHGQRTSGNSLGGPNSWTDATIFPVHLDTRESNFFETAIPTTGTLLLLPRFAHIYDPDLNPSAGPDPSSYTAPFNRANGSLAASPTTVFKGDMYSEYNHIDNGHMPVFDVMLDADSAEHPYAYHTMQVRSDSDVWKNVAGTPEGLDALPWGQLIFDYFTALPLDSTEVTGDDGRVSQPFVDMDGIRVSGRVNINAASYPVMEAVPLVKLDGASGPFLPETFLGATYNGPVARALYIDAGRAASEENPLGGFLSADTNKPRGTALAKAIAAYRDARDLQWVLVPDGAAGHQGDYNVYDALDAENQPTNLGRDPSQPPATDAGRVRAGFGFLTVGELLNVRDPGASRDARFDNGAVVYPNLDTGEYDVSQLDPAVNNYVYGVANLVAVGDWFTTKSHVFTVYGTIRGQFNRDASGVPVSESMAEANERAIHFRSTVNRLPMFFGAERPERIGGRAVMKYTDMREE